MEQKKCSKCNEIKTFDKFRNDNSKLNGKYSSCKECCHRLHNENKEKNNQQCKEYRKNNYEKELLRCKEYKATNYRKLAIKRWIDAGVRYLDFNELYEIYFNATHCYLCNVAFSKHQTKYKKVLEHDHLSNSPRFICCQSCNSKLMKIDNIRKDVLIELHRYFINNFEKIYLIKCIA